MFSRDGLTYRALPLPDKHAMRDEEMIVAAEAFRDHMRRRHTIRDFSARPVPWAVIEAAVAAAASAPSGANHQPWAFVAVQNPAMKARIRAEAEAEERKFYAGGGGDEWLRALEPIGTGPDKPHLDIAPWLIVIFAQRWGEYDDGTRFKNYYVPESVGIASGFLIAALHHAGLSVLVHTPNPMAFLGPALGRPKGEKPVMILAVGHAADGATVPEVAKRKKPLDQVLWMV